MLLFFDIDGTLFDEDRRLPSSVLPAMEAARKNGHRLIINTGRTLCMVFHWTAGSWAAEPAFFFRAGLSGPCSIRRRNPFGSAPCFSP